MNILYAEEDRDCRELFAYALRQVGHTLYEAVNGAQVVQLVRDEPIDLVILETRLPLLTGYDTAEKLAQEAPHLPVVFLSAKGMYREISHAFAVGDTVVDYWVKPVSPSQLVSWIDAVLQNCRKLGVVAIREETMIREFVVAQ